MSDVQAIVYKRVLCRIHIKEGSYMDQHNTPSSTSQEIRGATNSRRSTHFSTGKLGTVVQRVS